MNYFWVGLFGLIGVIARYQIGLGFDSVTTTFPYATLIVNLVGSFLIGFMYILLQTSKVFSPQISLAIMVGFLGGLTTFSSLTLDTFKLIQANQIRTAIIYISISFIGGMFLVGAGAALAKICFGKTAA